MHPQSAAAGRPTAAATRRVRRGALALAAIILSGASLPALAGPLGAERLDAAPLAEPAQFSRFMMEPGEVADALYSRYGFQRVMRIRSVGDVYEADAIDRRGYRVHVTVDGYNGRVLESFAVGSRAYDAPVPVPPRGVPGGYRRAPDESAALPSFPNEDDRFGSRPSPPAWARIPGEDLAGSHVAGKDLAPAASQPGGPDAGPLHCARSSAQAQGGSVPAQARRAVGAAEIRQHGRPPGRAGARAAADRPTPGARARARARPAARHRSA